MYEYIGAILLPEKALTRKKSKNFRTLYLLYSESKNILNIKHLDT